MEDAAMANGATRGDDKIVDCAKTHAAWCALGAKARKALSEALGGNGTVNRIRGYATLKTPPKVPTQRVTDGNLKIFSRHCGVEVETLLAAPAIEPSSDPLNRDPDHEQKAAGPDVKAEDQQVTAHDQAATKTPGDDPSAIDVFVSYASEDVERAIFIADALAKEGLRVWRDNQLYLHKALEAQIRQNLKAARRVLVLWSEHAVKSAWVRDEASYAREHDGKLVQAKLDQVRRPMGYGDLVCADLSGWEGRADHADWRRVVQSLKEGLGGSASSPREADRATQDRRSSSSSDDSRAEPGADPADDDYLRSCRQRLAEGLRTSMALTTFICQVVACPAAADPQARAGAVADRLVDDPRAGLSALRKAWNHFQRHGVEGAAEALAALRAPIRVLVPLVFGKAEVARMKDAMAGGGIALNIEVYFPAFVEGAMARREGRPGQWVQADDDYAWGFTALDRPAEGAERAFQTLPERVVTELFRLFVKRSGQGKSYEQKMKILKDRMKLYNDTPAGKYYYITNEYIDERDQLYFGSVLESLQQELSHVVFITCMGGDTRRKIEDDLIWGLAEYLYDE